MAVFLCKQVFTRLISALLLVLGGSAFVRVIELCDPPIMPLGVFLVFWLHLGTSLFKFPSLPQCHGLKEANQDHHHLY